MIKIKVFQHKETKRYFSNFTKKREAETVLKPEYAKVWVVNNHMRIANLKRFMKTNMDRLKELGFELIETEVKELQ